MQSISFKAFAITNEIDLNKIPADCGIPKKFTWEEPLILSSHALKRIYAKDVDQSQQVMVFAFGSVVFINNSDPQAIQTFFRYIQSFEQDIDLKTTHKYTDDYSLQIAETEETRLTDEYVEVQDYEAFYPELISTVLAKSVALENAEEQLGNILDNLEGIIDQLERGKLRVGNKKLARTTARILRHEYNTLAYIMILDKPDITWTNSQAAEFYDQMQHFFELSDRYQILQSKTQFLYNIMEGFSTISHSIRGLFVEWIVVILIVFEILLTIVGWLPPIRIPH